MDIRKVKKLIELLEESGIDELEIREGEESVRISRHSNKAMAGSIDSEAHRGGLKRRPAIRAAIRRPGIGPASRDLLAVYICNAQLIKTTIFPESIAALEGGRPRKFSSNLQRAMIVAHQQTALQSHAHQNRRDRPAAHDSCHLVQQRLLPGQG